MTSKAATTAMMGPIERFLPGDEIIGHFRIAHPACVRLDGVIDTDIVIIIVVIFHFRSQDRCLLCRPPSQRRWSGIDFFFADIVFTETAIGKNISESVFIDLRQSFAVGILDFLNRFFELGQLLVPHSLADRGIQVFQLTAYRTASLFVDFFTHLGRVVTQTANSFFNNCYKIHHLTALYSSIRVPEPFFLFAGLTLVLKRVRHKDCVIALRTC